jgi:hypothetical protein
VSYPKLLGKIKVASPKAVEGLLVYTSITPTHANGGEQTRMFQKPNKRFLQVFLTAGAVSLRRKPLPQRGGKERA